MNYQDLLICWHLLTEENSYWAEHWHQDDRVKESQWESDQMSWMIKSKINDQLLLELIIIRIHESNDWSFSADELFWNL